MVTNSPVTFAEFIRELLILPRVYRPRVPQNKVVIFVAVIRAAETLGAAQQMSRSYSVYTDVSLVPKVNPHRHSGGHDNL